MNPRLAVLVVISFKVWIDSRFDGSKANTLRRMAIQLAFYKVPVTDYKTARIGVFRMSGSIGLSITECIVISFVDIVSAADRLVVDSLAFSGDGLDHHVPVGIDKHCQ